jgi:hypothetical protein
MLKGTVEGYFSILDARFEIFMAVKIQVEFFWVVTSSSVVVGYHCFRGPCCPHLEGHFILNIEPLRLSKLVSQRRSLRFTVTLTGSVCA